MPFGNWNQKQKPFMRNMQDLYMIKITLPLPSKHLKPNRRSNTSHWPVTIARKEYRGWAYFAAVRVRTRDHPWSGMVKCQATFYHIINRRRDGDNANASLKSAYDGFQDANIVKNDSQFIHFPAKFEVDKKEPRVEITMEKFNG